MMSHRHHQCGQPHDVNPVSSSARHDGHAQGKRNLHTLHNQQISDNVNQMQMGNAGLLSATHHAQPQLQV